LWAVLIQLEHLRSYLCPNSDPDGTTAYKVFEEALHEVPKSGEVWCEGARLALHRGDYARARQFLDFSLHFTPQYGDSLIEYLRLALLEGEPQADLMKLHQVSVSMCGAFIAFFNGLRFNSGLRKCRARLWTRLGVL